MMPVSTYLPMLLKEVGASRIYLAKEVLQGGNPIINQ